MDSLKGSIPTCTTLRWSSATKTAPYPVLPYQPPVAGIFLDKGIVNIHP
jgi:hypothetical protein